VPFVRLVLLRLAEVRRTSQLAAKHGVCWRHEVDGYWRMGRALGRLPLRLRAGIGELTAVNRECGAVSARLVELAERYLALRAQRGRV
jgi:hypothetical protein